MTQAIAIGVSLILPSFTLLGVSIIAVVAGQRLYARRLEQRGLARPGQGYEQAGMMSMRAHVGDPSLERWRLFYRLAGLAFVGSFALFVGIFVTVWLAGELGIVTGWWAMPG